MNSSDDDLAMLAEIQGMMKWNYADVLPCSLRATLFLAEAVVSGHRIMLQDPTDGSMHEVHLGKSE